MNIQERKVWKSFLEELLKDKEESAGVTGIRVDLCSQIIDMSKNELFEFCQDLESIPCQLEKPEMAMNCDICRKEYGICPGRNGDVDFKICEKRFWNCAEKRASASTRIHQ